MVLSHVGSSGGREFKLVLVLCLKTKKNNCFMSNSREKLFSIDIIHAIFVGKKKENASGLITALSFSMGSLLNYCNKGTKLS